KKTPTVTRQVRDRLKQHALLVNPGNNKREFSFDHDHFREFFLGEQLGSHIIARQISDIRKILRTDLLPAWTLDTAVGVIDAGKINAHIAVQLVLQVAQSERVSSYVRENAAGILIRLFERTTEPVSVPDLTFGADALAGRRLNN